tara:strand:+ start:1940 stop:2809 length:870 start_codon:yes stop_codon:yes gene_type:complete
MPIIDSHLHLFKAVSTQYPRPVYPGLADAELEVTAEILLEKMEGARVDKAIVVPLGSQDEYLAEVIKRYPGKFAGIGVYDESASDQARNLDQRMKNANIQGIRIGLVDSNEKRPDDPRQYSMFPLLKAMAERDLRVWFYGESTQVALLPNVLDILPDLTIVFNHCGFMVSLSNLAVDEYGRPRFTTEVPPHTLDLLGQLADRQNTYVHFSGQYAFSHDEYPYKDMLPVAKHLYQTFGAERMMWASDFPWIEKYPGYQQQLDIVDYLLPDLDETEREKIRGGTADSLFYF